MATPAKRALDFDGVSSPNSNKKVSSNSLPGCDKIDEPSESPLEQSFGLNLCKINTEFNGSTFTTCNATSQKIKEFTPVKEEELGTSEMSPKDVKETASESDTLGSKILGSESLNDKKPSAKNDFMEKTKHLNKCEKSNNASNEMNSSKSVIIGSEYEEQEVLVTGRVANITKPDDATVLSKNHNIGTKNIATQKSNAIIPSKGYSAVTKASMNRSKTSAIANSNNVPAATTFHSKSCSGARANSLNSLHKSTIHGNKTAASNQVSGNKSMTSSTSSTTSTNDVNMTTSQTSSIAEKPALISSKASANNPSAATKKQSSFKSITSTTSTSNSVMGNNGEGSPKAQRVSLVQRQARFAASSSNTSSTTIKAPMTRSATTPTLSFRGKNVIGNITRPQSSKLANTISNTRKGMVTSTRNHVQLKASNSTPLANQSNLKSSVSSSSNQASGLHPFGSTSSISSSGSSRSWADTVKGLKSTTYAPSTTKSVENISMKNSSNEQELSHNVEEKPLPVNQDEGGEWETVRPRTRSRISPINSQLAKSRTSLSNSTSGSQELRRSSSFNDSTAEKINSDSQNKYFNKNIGRNNVATNNITNRANNSMPRSGSTGKQSRQFCKERYQLPSSAVSMPSLTVVGKIDKASTSQSKEDTNNKARTEKKPAMSKKLNKGDSVKDKRSKETQYIDRGNKNLTTDQANITSSGSSSESLEEKNSKVVTKSTKTSLKTRPSISNRIDLSSRERNAKQSVNKDMTRNLLPDNIKRYNEDNPTKDLIDQVKTNRMLLLKDCPEDKNEVLNGSVNGDICDESDNKENVPLKNIDYESINSCYPHQLDTCLEDDEYEGEEIAENEADSELAENEAEIALVEEEEESLAREIKETERSQLADDALDSSNECEHDDVENDDISNHSKSDTLSSIKLSNTIDNNSEKFCNGGPKAENCEPSTPSKYEALFEGLSWIDQIELEEQLVEARMPGRAIEIHEKLSSPARKREPHEAFKHHQEKQNKARVRRQMFQDEKAQRLFALNTRIEEVIAHREFLLSKRRDMIMKKMAKAEAKRQEHIDGIRKKAGEEEAKLKEIAFINELSAQNNRFDMLAQNQAADEKAEERLAEFAGERAKKAEQREAKEARAEERRRKLEDKRIKGVEALRIKILRREERIQEEQEQIRKDREEAAREKNRDREEKLSTVRAAEKDMKEELQEKIQQKMEEAAKRHQEKLQQVRHKAFELSIKSCSTEEGELEGGALLHPMLVAYDPKKKCEVCGILIHNEVQLQSHLRGKKHSEKLRNFVIAENEGKTRSRPSSSDNLVSEGRKMSGEEVQKYNLRYIVDAPVDELDPKMIQLKERNKAMKKRAKKIKNRMAIRAAEYEKMLLTKGIASKISDAPHKAKIGKSLRDIEKLLVSQGKGAWPNNSVSSLERALGEIVRSFQSPKMCGNVESQPSDKINSIVAQDKHAFYDMNGFMTLSKLFQLLADATPSTGIVIDQRPVCVIPLKSIVLCCKTWTSACSGHRNNTEFVLKSNYLSTISDILHHRLHTLIPEITKSNSKKKIETDSLGEQLPAPEGPQVDPVAKAIMISLAQCLEDLAVYLVADYENKIRSPKTNGQIKQISAFDDLALRVHDQVSYMIAIGIVDKLAAYFHSVQDPIDDRPEVGEFLLASLDLMSALTVCVEALAAKSVNSICNADATNRSTYRDLSSSSSVVDGGEVSTSSNSGKLPN